MIRRLSAVLLVIVGALVLAVTSQAAPRKQLPRPTPASPLIRNGVTRPPIQITPAEGIRLTNPLNATPFTPPSLGQQQWIVQLAGDPAVRVLSATQTATGSALEAFRAASEQRQRIAAEQAAFMDTLAAAGIQARLVRQTQFLTNMITIAIDDYPSGNLLVLLRSLPGVVAVFPDSTVTADSATRSPTSANPILPNTPNNGVHGD